ncbi:hypothetical protein L596_004525 [Steinernema carpocapsae]|uniref:Uncharacterized protein n=1 Tax=Steinernema carpocapsae TaxID=34508 RepID=A0A4U8UW85_STECR|nr:hypothetical protein L596_004525 [Steinernema carpocapsae]
MPRDADKAVHCRGAQSQRTERKKRTVCCATKANMQTCLRGHESVTRISLQDVFVQTLIGDYLYYRRLLQRMVLENTILQKKITRIRMRLR